MSKINPYGEILGDRDPLQVIESTPAKLRQALAAHAESAEKRPAEGRWSAREVVCHLADTEIVHAFRLRQSLAQPHHEIQPMEQDDWALRYDAYELPMALDTFAAVRRWNLRLVVAMQDADYERPLTHPERGTMTVRILVQTIAGHDLTHLRQLERIWRDLE